jgi:hypothetical protein
VRLSRRACAQHQIGGARVVPFGRTDDAAAYRRQFPISDHDHNGGDVAMARDLIAALEDETQFPVTPFQAIEAGLTVMAVYKAHAMEQIVDCAAIWDTLDTAMNVA